MASRARCPLQGPQLEGDWRRWEMGSGSSTPRGMARWRPMAMDCHRSCAASDEKSKVLGESADYQGEKVILLLLFYYHFIILSYAATKGQAKESCCPERPMTSPGDDKIRAAASSRAIDARDSRCQVQSNLARWN